MRNPSHFLHVNFWRCEKFQRTTKNSLTERMQPKKVIIVRSQRIDATIKLVTIFKRRCLLLARVTATSTVAIMVAAARVDVGSCSLTHYARNDDDCRRGVGGERGSMGLVKFRTASVGRERRRRCSCRRPRPPSVSCRCYRPEMRRTSTNSTNSRCVHRRSSSHAIPSGYYRRAWDPVWRC